MERHHGYHDKQPSDANDEYVFGSDKPLLRLFVGSLALLLRFFVGLSLPSSVMTHRRSARECGETTATRE